MRKSLLVFTLGASWNPIDPAPTAHKTAKRSAPAPMSARTSTRHFLKRIIAALTVKIAAPPAMKNGFEAFHLLAASKLNAKITVKNVPVLTVNILRHISDIISFHVIGGMSGSS